ncbi:hypothetical protein CRU96_12765 [Malaciobacter halophilus]|nr:hypothetical protein [Malaciobacter halophilus]RYA22490.1 hypothetical protein CRU96_12765 [Malaciobacter halophilus]
MKNLFDETELEEFRELDIEDLDTFDKDDTTENKSVLEENKEVIDETPTNTPKLKKTKKKYDFEEINKTVIF